MVKQTGVIMRYLSLLFTALFLFVALMSTITSAQPPELLWNYIYGGSGDDRSYCVQQTTDGGFILTGLTDMGPFGLIDAYLLKTDENGDSLWMQFYGNSDWDESNWVEETSGGGFILAGSVQGSGSYFDLWIIRTDSNGDTLWTRTFGESSYEDRGICVKETTDGGFIIVGSTASYSYGSDDIYLVKLDSDGDSLWTRHYGGENWDQGLSVVEAPDGGYVITGATMSFGAGEEDIFLLKTDANGDSSWMNTYGGTDEEVGYAVILANDGDGFVITGCYESGGSGGEDGFLMETDLNGDSHWMIQSGGESDDRFTEVTPTSDNGYLLSGFYHSTGSAGEGDFWLTKIDSEGNLIWETVWGDVEADRLFAAYELSQGGFIVCGHTRSYGAAYRDIYLARFLPVPQPEIMLSDSTLDYGTVNVGSQVELPLTIYSQGDTTLILYDIFSSDSSVFFTDFDPADSLINPGDSLVVMVTFTPQEAISYQELLTVDNNASLEEVLLTGTGYVPQPGISISDSTLDYGTVTAGSQVELPLTIYSQGDTTLILYDIFSSDSSVFYTDFNPADSLLAPGDSLTIIVTFAPLEAISYQELITVDNNASLEEVLLTGTGYVPQAGISVSQNELNFGAVTGGTQSDLPLTIYSTGDTTLIINNIFSGDTTIFFTDFDPADSLLVPGDSIVVTVSFLPLQIGLYNDSLTIQNNDETVIVQLTGEGDSLSYIPGGDVTGLWAANGSPYWIDGEITVPVGDTLAIEAGVEIIFGGHYELTVNGGLIAQGAEGDSILFTVVDTVQGWHGIRFENATDACELSYCIIEYGNAFGTHPECRGGGIYCLWSNPLIVHCNIRNNSAFDGGGISLYNSHPTISECSFTGNSGGIGGAIRCKQFSSVTIENCLINGNTAETKGGGVECGYYSEMDLIYCEISSNTSAEYGGGLHFEDYSDVEIFNCTVSANSAQGDGDGIYCDSTGSLTILNSIVWENSDSEIYGLPEISYCDILGGWPGIGNISEDPQFVDPVGGDYHLFVSSPCIDTGDPSSPLDPDSTRADMGAYYYEQTGAPQMIVDVNYVSGSPVSIGGGNLYYGIWGENQGSVPLDWDVWIDMVYENQDTTMIILRAMVNYQPGWQISRPDAFYPVPESWPGGNYDLTIHSGIYSTLTVWHRGSFSWTKEGSVDLDFDFNANLPTCSYPDPFDDIVSTQQSVLIPGGFEISGAYPNPFNPQTTIRFGLPVASQVNLTIYNLAGRKVATVVDGYRSAGYHEVIFDASQLSSGLYFYRIQAGNFTDVKKMILVK
ncbi:hypothetical protein CEE37_01775 [candidate division LCP-89 bacterium B3_LCP]|uniref:Secretion system C-terminal sorting domain-containing protein n=1 Tax=candidate division LCP-89 bacterium B3_LCP TaxID=2012998 RepID=A0A532V5G0_UNCL8|nr:MAG: hypothetical protein CEE37_01775 [candidate division LCP-89 bacterium B3_LCP]